MHAGTIFLYMNSLNPASGVFSLATADSEVNDGENKVY